MAIKKITIPIKENECTIGAVEPYLTRIYTTFMQNAREIQSYRDVYRMRHSILGKTRLHEGENHIVLSPHIKNMVDWKTGYTLGTPIKYAQSKNSQTDDVTLLNTYIRNSKKRTVDTEVAKWTYTTGVGYYFIQPKSHDFDAETEAPFDLYCIDSDKCFKVYSAYLGNAPLFDVLLTTFDRANQNVTIMSVYMRDNMYEYETTGGTQFKRTNVQPRGIYRSLPLVEKRYFDGIGIAEIAISLQNAIDSMSSDAVDNINDCVNALWVFLNTTLGKTPEQRAENLALMRQLGAIELLSPNPELRPDLKILDVPLNLDQIQSLRATLLREMYDVVGVPIASNNISSGNVTKGGSETANGYENAKNRAMDDINSFITADTELLERILEICEMTPACKIKQLSASEIEIKYCLNISDNMLVKTQSFDNLIEYMPPAMALEKAGISNDAEAEGIIIEEYLAKKQVSTSENS